MDTTTQSIIDNTKLLSHLKDEAVIYAVNNGLLMFDKNGQPHHAPFTLLPRPIPSNVYHNIISNHPILQELYAKIANDHDFLLEHLGPMAHSDPFLSMLLDTLKQNYNTKSPICLISRSDYMIHEEDDHNTLDNTTTTTTTKYTAQQVEFNCISTGFVSLSSKVTQLHRYLISSHLNNTTGYNISHIPDHMGPNGPAALFAHTIDYLSHIYTQYTRQDIRILMVVQPGESNAADQRHIEYSLYHGYGIHCIRATLLEIEQYITYNQSTDTNLPLWNDPYTHNIYPIGIIYYRSCYTPRDFDMVTHDTNMIRHDNIVQQERLVKIYQSLEQTNAIKCPNIGLHLAGTKKIQQVLCNRSILEHYMDHDNDKVDCILSLFTDIYPLQNPYNDPLIGQCISDAITNAINTPSDYVLKPMREGGGNNYYDDQLKTFLLNQDTNDITAMILMKKIKPNTSQKQIFIRHNNIDIMNAVSEYGVYGGYFAPIIDDNNNAIKNKVDTSHAYNTTIGLLVRTKAEGVNEGGVAAGFSCIDSPILYEP